MTETITRSCCGPLLNSEAPFETGGSQPTKRSDRAAMGLGLPLHDANPSLSSSPSTLEGVV